MFTPFAQHGEDRSGLGLGLFIARRSVEADAGTLSVRDVPGTGCVFTIKSYSCVSIPEPIKADFPDGRAADYAQQPPACVELLPGKAVCSERQHAVSRGLRSRFHCESQEQHVS
jgi:hypothetical protein